MPLRAGITAEHFRNSGDGHLPGLLGVRVVALIAKPAHLGRNTQVWDATVTHRETGKTIAFFRRSQRILWSKG